MQQSVSVIESCEPFTAIVGQVRQLLPAVFRSEGSEAEHDILKERPYAPLKLLYLFRSTPIIFPVTLPGDAKQRNSFEISESGCSPVG